MNGHINTNTRTGNNVSRECEFRVINGRMVTVGVPRPLELEGLRARFSIKPWTDRNSRSYLEAAVQAAKSSLKAIPISTIIDVPIAKVPIPIKV
jgi:hypothetical protein